MKLPRFLRACIDVLLPDHCTTCNSPVGASGTPHFCAYCWSDFSLLRGPACPRCGALFESLVALEHSPSHLCLSCRNDPPGFDQAVAVGHFEGSLRDAIHVFKYSPCRSLGKRLGGWMSEHIRLAPGIDLVMPVPLHKARLRRRGFNQALLLAHEICRTRDLALSYDNLARIRHTRPQVELSREERVSNVAGAFALRRPDEVAGKTVLLVDDVFTSGATLNECAKELKAHDAGRVLALTLARAQ